mmetsp:Transcript_18202/g.72840  ORF Transcript_18202/g.72840 Transcript_18202/m.72840 type:complete len:86 (-) Transcript_18202:126-383(-)
MHPPLDRPHPMCDAVVRALKRCHTDHPNSKFWGACNDAKAALDLCLKEEKEERRQANLDKARRFRQTRADHEADRQPAAVVAHPN